MDPFKLIVGSKDPKITKILSKLSKEEVAFLSVIEEKSDLMRGIKKAQNCTVIIDAAIGWEEVQNLPSHVLTINRKSRIILVAANGIGPVTFHSIIKPEQLLELSNRIIAQNMGRRLEKVQ